MGLLIGVIASWALVRLLGGLLFGVTATDPVTFASMPGVLTIVAALAGYIPARRASRIDPITALRAQQAGRTTSSAPRRVPSVRRVL